MLSNNLLWNWSVSKYGIHLRIFNKSRSDNGAYYTSVPKSCFTILTLILLNWWSKNLFQLPLSSYPTVIFKVSIHQKNLFQLLYLNEMDVYQVLDSYLEYSVNMNRTGKQIKMNNFYLVERSHTVYRHPS